MVPLALRLQVAHYQTGLVTALRIYHLYCENSSNMQKYFISIFHKCWIFSENICDLFIAAPGCMSAFFPNPQQLEIFEASSEQIAAHQLACTLCPGIVTGYLN